MLASKTTTATRMDTQTSVRFLPPGRGAGNKRRASKKAVRPVRLCCCAAREPKRTFLPFVLYVSADKPHPLSSSLLTVKESLSAAQNFCRYFCAGAPSMWCGWPTPKRKTEQPKTSLHSKTVPASHSAQKVTRGRWNTWRPCPVSLAGVIKEAQQNGRLKHCLCAHSPNPSNFCTLNLITQSVTKQLESFS